MAARRGPRPERTAEELLEAERSKIEGRALEEWIDEGALRAEAAGATSRALGKPARRQRSTHLDPETAAEIGSVVRDPRRAAVLRERLAQAQDALDHERYDEARHVSTRLLRELSTVAAVHQVLGLAAYRSGRWKQAAGELELALQLSPDVTLLPVLADAYRALKRWRDVEQVWADVRAASPSQEILAEARIVAAGAQADQGDLQGALQTMSRTTQVPKRVREHHLRQWYVLADLHDRAGDTLQAARWFERIAATDRDFVDVAERLRALGR